MDDYWYIMNGSAMGSGDPGGLLNQDLPLRSPHSLPNGVSKLIVCGPIIHNTASHSHIRTTEDTVQSYPFVSHVRTVINKAEPGKRPYISIAYSVPRMIPAMNVIAFKRPI